MESELNEKKSNFEINQLSNKDKYQYLSSQVNQSLKDKWKMYKYFFKNLQTFLKENRTF